MPTFEEVQSFIEQNQNDEKVKNYIGGFVTPDRVSSFLESDEGKKVLQPKLDKYHNKSLESWKQNNLPKLIDEEVTKRNPAETEEQKRLRKIEEENNNLQNKIKRGELKDKYIKVAQQDKVPISLLDFVITSDENETQSRYDSIKSVFNSELDKALKSAFAQYGKNPPPKGDDKNTSGINGAIRKAAGY
jgi:hypothetical protein